MVEAEEDGEEGEEDEEAWEEEREEARQEEAALRDVQHTVLLATASDAGAAWLEEEWEAGGVGEEGGLY